MGQTRRVRKGGDRGIVNTFKGMLGFQTSPFRGPAVSKQEKTLVAQIKQLEEGIPSVKQLANYEGFNASESIQKMKQELDTLKRKLSNLRGETQEESWYTNPGFKNGGRYTRKQTRRRMTKRRRYA
jgi:hypothetical protein